MAEQTKQVAGEGKLSQADVVDTADTTARAAGPDLSGKRVRAIPGAGGTTVKVRARDFADNGIEHDDVVFDFRKDQFTLPVGKDKALSTEAADFLTKNYPTSFEYLDNKGK